ncbi:MAG TPA: MFS transporter [Nocardioidaceae bacterium]|nr:MFS transporter [Nocardioidaceae bacterium]
MSLWRHRDFRRFWSAQGVSELGDRVTELAIPLIAVTTLHASPQQVGLLTAVVWLPYIPSIFIGAWVDQQRRKRRLMIAADLFRLVVLVSLPLAAWGGVLGIGQLYGVALLTGAAKVVFDTSYLSFFVRLVTKEQYVEANSKLSSTRAVSFIAGPAVGGALIQILTAPLAVAVDAVSFAFSALQISRVRVADVEPDRSEGSLLRRARDGMVFLFRDRLLARSCAR